MRTVQISFTFNLKNNIDPLGVVMVNAIELAKRFARVPFLHRLCGLCDVQAEVAVLAANESEVRTTIKLSEEK